MHLSLKERVSGPQAGAARGISGGRSSPGKALEMQKAAIGRPCACLTKELRLNF